jgi:hypothetical protein
MSFTYLQGTPIMPKRTTLRIGVIGAGLMGGIHIQ